MMTLTFDQYEAINRNRFTVKKVNHTVMVGIIIGGVFIIKGSGNTFKEAWQDAYEFETNTGAYKLKK